jgi:hypothetical protein
VTFDPNAALAAESKTNDVGSDSRHPDEFLLLLLCFVAAVGIVFGDVPEPGTIEASLPRWAAIAWGYGLLIGPAITVGGIVLASRAKHRLDGLLTEQIGQVITGGVALFYGTVLLVEAYPASLVSACIIYAFAGARLWRWIQIQRLLRRARAHVESVESPDAV